MDLYNQYLIPTIYTLAAAKQVGLNSFPPNSTPSATAFHRSNPTNLFSLRSLRILWFLRFPIFGGLVFFLNGEGLDLESVQSQQKESGRSNWAAGGRKSQCSASAWGWRWRFFVKILFYSFSAKIASQSLFLECKFKSFSSKIYQMSYSVFPANLWVRIWCSNKWFHTTKANYHQACPYPLLKPPWFHGWFAINGQW